MTVDNTLKLKQLHQVAAQAQQLKENDVWVLLLKQIKQTHLEAWAMSKPDDTLTRENCWRMFKAVEDLEGELGAAIYAAYEDTNTNG
jgi:hypothetical protein